MAIQAAVDLNHVGRSASTLERTKSERLPPAELREQARSAWLELRNQPDKPKGKDKSKELDAGDEDDRGKKDKGNLRDGPDDDFGL